MSTANLDLFPLNAFADAADRVFFQANQITGLATWFFRAREGIMGPYETRATAEQRLMEFKAFCQRAGITGNRPLSGAASNPPGKPE